MPLLHCMADVCDVDCGLHLILSVHRQLWKYTVHVAQSAQLEQTLSPALRAAGCDYIAFQMDLYYSRYHVHISHCNVICTPVIVPQCLSQEKFNPDIFLANFLAVFTGENRDAV